MCVETRSHQLNSTPQVIFDLFNEPYPDGNTYDSTAAWECWRNGCYYSGPGNSHLQNYSYNIVGFQDLVNTVRATGAQNVIMLGGINYANSLVQWLQYMPIDPTGNLVASWHSYDFNHCDIASCWVWWRVGVKNDCPRFIASPQNSDIAPVMEKVPVLTGEIGENDCAHNFIDTLMPWLDARNSSYLAWTWVSS